ncbi:trypsin-like peptidase domain-containing protein [Rubrivirga sp. IMCC43871]|uniref:trypsin-like peptidase domain-containing protein n=1 Tax=Rubrivirga sp. IMCC43871 TaxID=3391575 RepID=UPI00399038C0
MSLRRLLFGLAALAVGVLIGLPVVRLLQPDVQPGPGTVREATATPAAVETVQIGADRPPVTAASEIPDLVDISQQTVLVAREVEPAVVFIKIEVPTGYGRFTTETGSGIIISPAGYVLTNAHVVARTNEATIVMPSLKREYRAEVVGRDPTTDVAVLRLLEVGVTDDTPLPVAALGDSDALSVGEWVLVVGSPYGLQNSITSGIISALGRGGLQAIQDDFAIEDFIQTDAAINPGNSGGALINLRGEVVGLVTANASENGASAGYGFAVPINLARVVAEDLIRYGEVRRGYLGVEVYPVDQADAREAGMPDVRGVLVNGVVSGGPADRAGIRQGDVLLEVGGRPVDATNQFQSRMARFSPGEQVSLSIWSRGEERQFRATLSAPQDPSLEDWFSNAPSSSAPPSSAPVPEGPIARSEAPDWGVRFRDLSRAERRRFESGAYVETVEPGSAAELDGLPRGTVVVEIEDRPVTTAEEARAALSRQARLDRPALLRVRRDDGRTAFYDLASPFVD